MINYFRVFINFRSFYATQHDIETRGNLDTNDDVITEKVNPFLILRIYPTPVWSAILLYSPSLSPSLRLLLAPSYYLPLPRKKLKNNFQNSHTRLLPYYYYYYYRGTIVLYSPTHIIR